MLIGVGDRLLLLNLTELPVGSSLIELRTRQELISQLGFSSEDITETGLEQKGDFFDWKTNINKEVQISPAAAKYFIRRLEFLDQQMRLVPGHLPLYEQLTSIVKEESNE